jgi:hypothetical protein
MLIAAVSPGPKVTLLVTCMARGVPVRMAASLCRICTRVLLPAVCRLQAGTALCPAAAKRTTGQGHWIPKLTTDMPSQPLAQSCSRSTRTHVAKPANNNKMSHAAPAPPPPGAQETLPRLDTQATTSPAATPAYPSCSCNPCPPLLLLHAPPPPQKKGAAPAPATPCCRCKPLSIPPFAATTPPIPNNRGRPPRLAPAEAPAFVTELLLACGSHAGPTSVSANTSVTLSLQ